MRILCAPNSFKESMTARQAAEAMARGIASVLPDAITDLCPIADGGDGTVDAMLFATAGRERVTTVTGPLGEPVAARWGVLGDGHTAIIEMAKASGMALLPPQRRDPTRTSTIGTGELIRAALDAGVQHILLGIGGSATNDGGCGCAQALGIRFLDRSGHAITDPITGGMLTRIAAIDRSRRDTRLDTIRITVACDVTNPLTGPNGAAHIYGPQKGATPQQVLELDAGLKHLARLYPSHVETTPGAGAAGGLGAGLMALLDAHLKRGIDMVLDAVRFDERVRTCDLCLTGEGRLDGQSLSGKACMGVVAAAHRRRVPTIALVGSLGPDVEKTLAAGLNAYHPISEGLPLEEAIRRGAELLESATARLMKTRK